MRKTTILLAALGLGCDAEPDPDPDYEGFDSEAADPQEDRQGEWGEEGPGCDPESAEGLFDPESPEELGEVLSEAEQPTLVDCNTTHPVRNHWKAAPIEVTYSARDLCYGDGNKGAKSKMVLLDLAGKELWSKAVGPNWDGETVEMFFSESLRLVCVGDNKSTCGHCEYFVS